MGAKNINYLFKSLTEVDDTIEYQTFFALLEKIKYIPSFLEYFGEDFVEHMLLLLSRVKEKHDQAILIETVMECLDIYTFSEACIKDIFEKYMSCIAEKVVSLNGLTMCLIGFIQAGISEEQIIIRLEENLEKEHVINVLSRLYINYFANSSEANSGLLREAQKAYYISQRSGIIAQFLLLVHPHIRKYAGLSQITFMYDSYRGVYEDCWPRGLLPNMKGTLIKSKILSSNEVGILEELDTMINLQGEALESMKVRELYDAFFEGKDPFEVIFTLPE